MIPAAKLIRQIRATLAADGASGPVETLSKDYAKICQEANHRLESCEAMLAKGSEYQALQLAETEPALLDLVATLSFAEAPEWAAYCEANQLDSPVKFDPKAIQSIASLYAKGISPNHGLYKDYRAAVTSRDDTKSIQIIRSIVRLNPDDTNAKLEFARLENKLFQIKLLELRTAIARTDELATISALGELERVGTKARLEGLPEFAHASQIRGNFARLEAIAVSERLVDSLNEEREAGSWRMIGDILARIDSLLGEHNFALPQDNEKKCAEMRQYFTTQRDNADEAARFARALSTLTELAESLDLRLLARSTLTFGETENLQVEFNRCWKVAEMFQRPIADDFIQRLRKSASALRTEIERLQKQRRLKIVSGSAIVIMAVVSAVWFTANALRAQDFAVQLAGLREAGHVSAAEKMISMVWAEHAALAANPRLKARIDEVEQWIRGETAKLSDIESRVAALEATASTGLIAADPMSFTTKLESASQLIEKVAEDFRSAPAGRLLVVKNHFEAQIAVLRESLAEQADTELTDLEKLAGISLGYEQTKEKLLQALEQLDPKLKSLEVRSKPACAALELPFSQQARMAALRKRSELFKTEIDTLTTAREAAYRATTLDSFMEALGGFKASQLSQDQEVIDARKLLAASVKPDDFLAGLLLPDDPVGWASAKRDTTVESMTPSAVFPAEISRLFAVRDDEYLNNVWEITFIDYRRKNEQRELYAQGDLKIESQSSAEGIQTTEWVGKIHDPKAARAVPTFILSKITMKISSAGGLGDGEVKEKRASASSEYLRRLELSRMTNEDGSKFERPLLRVFDDLIHDKTANPIFKAYLMQQMGELLKIQPNAWGLQYCATLRKDLAELGRLCDGIRLRNQDWLMELKKTQLQPRLINFFKEVEGHTYFAEARLHRDVVRGVLNAGGLQFGGFLDSEGRPHLLGEGRGAKGLWAIGSDGQKLVRYVPNEAKNQGVETQKVGFSPLFFIPLDRDVFLAELTRKTSAFTGVKAKLPTIPWIETP